ncbi:MAG: hypothetical protein GY816_09615, partial [Cytophagales bacterium]|nr:hypothetical protein [Cytophagales bacterium]
MSRLEFAAELFNLKTGRKELAAAFRGAVSQFLISKLTRFPLTWTIPAPLKEAAKSLKESESIMVLKADKSNTLVVLNQEDYVAKITEMLENSGDYKCLQEDPSPKINQLFDNTLKRAFSPDCPITEMKKTNPTKFKEYQKCLKTHGRCAPFYALPKIHKLGSLPVEEPERAATVQQLKFRPITPSFDTIDARLCSHLTNVISQLPRSPYSLRNSSQFLEELRTVNVHRTDILVSFDVVSLFTRVPVDEA